MTEDLMTLAIQKFTKCNNPFSSYFWFRSSWWFLSWSAFITDYM